MWAFTISRHAERGPPLLGSLRTHLGGLRNKKRCMETGQGVVHPWQPARMAALRLGQARRKIGCPLTGRGSHAWKWPRGRIGRHHAAPGQRLGHYSSCKSGCAPASVAASVCLFVICAWRQLKKGPRLFRLALSAKARSILRALLHHLPAWLVGSVPGQSAVDIWLDMGP